MIWSSLFLNRLSWRTFLMATGSLGSGVWSFARNTTPKEPLPTTFKSEYVTSTWNRKTSSPFFLNYIFPFNLQIYFSDVKIHRSSSSRIGYTSIFASECQFYTPKPLGLIHLDPFTARISSQSKTFSLFQYYFTRILAHSNSFFSSIIKVLPKNIYIYLNQKLIIRSFSQLKYLSSRFLKRCSRFFPSGPRNF